MRMMQYWSRLCHAPAKTRPVLHHLSWNKASKVYPSVLLRLGDLSANQMRETQMKLLTELV